MSLDQEHRGFSARICYLDHAVSPSKKHRSPDAVIYSFLQAGGSAESLKGGYTMVLQKDMVEKLALLYLDHQDISDLSPEELFDKFTETCERIQSHQAEGKPQQRVSY